MLWPSLASATIIGSSALSAPVRRDGYPLKSDPRLVKVLLLISACRAVFLNSLHVDRRLHTVDSLRAIHVALSSCHVLSSASDFHRASTLFFVASSINISSGHGRVKPSDAHLRVASIPIFDPKSCIRAA